MKTIVFDFDGTLTQKSNEIWRRIWIAIDASDTDEILCNKYINGEIDYLTWCKEIQKEFIKRKVNKELLNELIQDIKMMENLEKTLTTLKNKGYNLIILSGGIDYVIHSLLKENVNYFSEIRSSKFHFSETGNLIRIEDTDSDEEGKARFILNYIKQTQSNPDEIIFIGNGHNDRFVSTTGCHTICLNPNGTNHNDKNIWHHYINGTKDLSDILIVIDEIHKKTNK